MAANGFEYCANSAPSQPRRLVHERRTYDPAGAGHRQRFVTDFDRAVTCYRDLLGFQVAFTYGEPPFYGQVRRDDAVLNLRHVDDSPFVEGIREQDQLLSAYVVTTSATELFGEFDAAGVEFQERLQAKPWGATEFVVRDPDGNLIAFGTPTSA